MKLRPATLADVPTLDAWDQQAHVINATGSDDGMYDWATEVPRQVDWRELLIAEIAGRPIGMLQIIDPAREESHYWGDIAPNLRAIDIWIGSVADLGRGCGTAMMNLALARCFAPPEVTAVLVDPLVANTRSHRFYERMGFRRIGRHLFGEDDCYVYRLEGADWRTQGKG